MSNNQQQPATDVKDIFIKFQKQQNGTAIIFEALYENFVRASIEIQNLKAELAQTKEELDLSKKVVEPESKPVVLEA